VILLATVQSDMTAIKRTMLSECKMKGKPNGQDLEEFSIETLTEEATLEANMDSHRNFVLLKTTEVNRKRLVRRFQKHLTTGILAMIQLLQMKGRSCQLNPFLYYPFYVKWNWSGTPKLGGWLVVNIVSSQNNEIIVTCNCSNITQTVNIAVGGLLLCTVFLQVYVI